MKKEGKVDLKIIILILFLVIVLLSIAYAAVTIDSVEMSGNITVATGNTINGSTWINVSLSMPTGASSDDNVTNVTIMLNGTYLTFVNSTETSNATDAPTNRFTNSSGGGYIILYWNISGSFDNGTSYFFSFNVTPLSNVEELNTIIRVQALNVSGGTELLLDNSASTIHVDNKAPVVSFITVNNTNSSTNVSVLLNFSMIDINNDTCILYVNSTLAEGPDWGSPVDNLSANTGSGIGFYYNFSAGDGDYFWNVWCNDTLGHVASTTGNNTITIDTASPVYGLFNITNATLGTAYNMNVTNEESSGSSVNQGDTVTAWFNFTDATTGVLTAFLQVYNLTTDDWMNITPGDTAVMNVSDTALYTINYTFCTLVDCYQSGTNVTMRVVAKDYVGNENTTRNLTVQVNDTVKPAVTVTINGKVNNTNISTTTFILNWTITERNNITWLYYAVDGNTAGAYSFNFTWDEVDTDAANHTQRDKLKTGSVLPVKSTSALPSSAATLGDGVHGVELIVKDSWGNIQTAQYNFTVDTTVPQEISLHFNTTNADTVSGGDGITPTNVTSAVWVGINVSSSSSGLSTLQYNTSCNGTLATVVNFTWFQPFNNSLCEATLESQKLHNLTVVATNAAGGSNTTTFSVGLDNTVPDITLYSIDAITSYNGTEFNSVNISLNVSTPNEWTYLSSVGYYLDGNPYVSFTTDANQLISYNYSINVTYGGKHTLKIFANDSVSNAENTTQYTFTVVGPVDTASKQAELNASLGPTHVGRVIIRNVSKATTLVDSIIVNSSNTITLAIDLELNTSQGTALNMTIDGINASAVNWAYINFSVTSEVDLDKLGISTNFSATVLRMVRFNSSIDDFISNTNAYYGRVVVPYNITSNESNFVVMWFEDESDYSSRTLVSVCTAGTGGKTTPYTSTKLIACYNTTSNISTTIFVPHFSTVTVVNDSNVSNVAIIAPTINEDTSSFQVNLTVQGDVSSCAFKLNKSGYYDGSANAFTSWISMTPTGTSPKECLSSGIVSLVNETGGAPNGAYNLTINVTDAVGNQNISYYAFNVTDSVPPQYSDIANKSITSIAATINVTSNEYVNASVTYGGTGLVKVQNDPSFTTRTPIISLTSLSAEILINYTVKVCDYAGNCNTSGIYNFTTDVAAAAEAPAAAAGGGGGGIGYQIAASNVKATTSHMWSSISSGESVSMGVINPNIGVTSVNVNVKNAVSNAKISVASLKAKPDDVTAAAATVYQYLQITATNIKDADITRATIKFKVLKSWLTDNSVAEDDVLLFRYADAWSTLVTTKVDSDGTYVYYEATTTGFSYYAIGTGVTSSAALELIDMVRAFYEGTSSYTALEIIDKIRAFYGG